MHEMSIAQSLLDIIIQESKQHQVSRVLAVSLKVGEMSGVETESLRFCFELITEGTLAEGARLEIEKLPIACRCQDCGHEFAVQNMLFSCPVCASPKAEMISGRELNIESFEAE
jgi:hydrogenase nickel incorporation protein HypA/HybF